MAQINFKQLEAFVQVADMASFRRAAEKLNTTQPNISSRIAGLEARLGLTLMERDAGSVRLTPAGEKLLPKARQVLASMDGFLVAADQDHLFEGVLRLGVNELIAHTWLGSFMAALKDRFPNVDVDLMVDLSSNVSEALFSRAVDLALQSGPFRREIAGFEKLGEFPLIWVGTPQFRLGEAEVSLEQLSEFSVVTHAKGTRPYQQLNAHFVQAGADVRIFPSTNLAACLQMTLNGLGVACLPEAMVRKELANGELMRLHYPWTPDPLSFFARYHADTGPSLVAEAAKLSVEIAAAYHQNNR